MIISYYEAYVLGVIYVLITLLSFAVDYKYRNHNIHIIIWKIVMYSMLWIVTTPLMIYKGKMLKFWR